MRLFKKDLRRFDLAKQAVQKEIEKNPIVMRSEERRVGEECPV